MPPTITLRSRDRVLRAELFDTSAGLSLLGLLPRDLVFRDLNDVEKIADLDMTLDTAGMPSGSSASPGDLGYWRPPFGALLRFRAELERHQDPRSHPRVRGRDRRARRVIPGTCGTRQRPSDCPRPTRSTASVAKTARD